MTVWVNDCMHVSFGLSNSIPTTRLDRIWRYLYYLDTLEKLPEIDSAMTFISNNQFVKGTNKAPGNMVTGLIVPFALGLK